MNQPLIIKDWDKGIAESAHVGIGLMKNVDIESFPGAVKVSKKPQVSILTITNRTFTADASTDICTASGSLYTGTNFSGSAVYFTTTGTLPAGLSTGTVYFLIYASATTFKVATSYKNSAGSAAGTAIDITSSGSGTHTINSVTPGTINHIKKDARTGFIYSLDSNGRVWGTLGGGSIAFLLHNSSLDNGASALTNSSGNGLVTFNNSNDSATYLFVFRNALIDVINVYGNTAIETPSWTNGWKTMNTGVGTANSHEALVGQDNKIYYCDGRYVGSIAELTAFDPATGSTYTWTSQALDLPQNEIAQCLEEIGSNLLVGGNSFNKIYPWDRVSSSYNSPMYVPETAIVKMKNNGNAVYILAGITGNIYYTQGSYVRFFKKIPQQIINLEGAIQTNQVTWGGIGSASGALLIGLVGITTGSGGLYKINQDGTMIMENMPSTGTGNVTAIYAESNFYYMGYAGNFDNFSSSRYSSYETVIQSPLYRIGTMTNKQTFRRVELQMAQPQSTGHARVSYRNNSSSSFTTLSTFTADGITTVFTSDTGITDIQNIQIQIEMDGNFELMEVRLIP